MKTYLKLIIFFFPVLTIAQNHDYVWTFGYSGEVDHPHFEATNLDFKFSPPKVIPSSRPVWIGGVNASICDEQGNLLAFSNGVSIYDKTENIMVNGDSLNPGPVLETYYNYGCPIWYAGFFLPEPGNKKLFRFLHFSWQDGPDVNYVYENFYYSLIDFSRNGGLGEVVEKNQLIDKGIYSPASACKHGNGRDWWVVVPDNPAFTTDKHIYYFNPDSISLYRTQSIGEKNNEILSGGNRNGFSSDGSIYVQMDGYYGIYLYDFDRCEGVLSNYRVLKFFQEERLLGNFELSPNNRFLYFNTHIQVMQLDLWADTINWSAVDTVATFDGHSEWDSATTFNQLQLGPDGKIYISTTTSSNILHIIHEPDKKGLACNLEQHALRLAGRHRYSMPYFPNFRLGPLERSVCDSLEVTSAIEILNEINFNIFPNPTSVDITIQFEEELSENCQFLLFNLEGKQIFELQINKGVSEQKVNLLNKPTGIFYYYFKSENGAFSEPEKLIIKGN